MATSNKRAVLEEKARRYGQWAITDLREGGDLTDRTRLKITNALPNIESAIEAIDAGTYGICQDCGEPIPEKRMNAVPGATRCIGCQEAHDDKR